MKTASIVVLFLSLFAPVVFADIVKPDDERAILAAEKQWAEATIKKDTATLEKILSDDLTWTHTNSKHDTKTDLINGIKVRKLQYATIENQNTKRQQYGDVVVATYDQRVKWPEGGSYNFVTLIWVKQGGNWKIVSRHATENPK